MPRDRLVSWLLILGGTLLGSVGCATTERRGDRVPFGNGGTAPSHERSRAASTPSAAINAEEILEHIRILAHDSMEGRGTGTRGIDLAAGYIAGQFSTVGLQPGALDGSYFQRFEVDGTPRLAEGNELTVNEGVLTATVESDFMPVSSSASGSFEGALTSVGFGLVDEEAGRDDYHGVDVSGRVVMMYRREPGPRGQGRPNRSARLDARVLKASERGAVAVLLLNPPDTLPEEDRLSPLRRAGETWPLPVIQIRRAFANQLLHSGGSTLAEWEDSGNDVGLPAQTAMSRVRVRGTVALEVDRQATQNVVGLLPGQGPHHDEYVVIGGHYDHLGTNRGRIYNGADDNASGVAAVIEVARAFARNEDRDRGIVFLAFSGEEIGLLGSEHYVNEPTVPLERIVAMINLDMIGRWEPTGTTNGLTIQGLGTGSTFEPIIRRRAQEHGIRYSSHESALGPSDHASFYRGGVPSLFFFTGVHADYHRPTDDTELVNVDGTARLAGFIHSIATDLVAARDTPKYVVVNVEAPIDRTASRMSVVMGITPNWSRDDDSPGWLIGEVVPSGGAGRAGLRSGDRIISINGQSINGFEDYLDAVRGKSPGDAVEVRVRRGQDPELTLIVELDAREPAP